EAPARQAAAGRAPVQLPDRHHAEVARLDAVPGGRIRLPRPQRPVAELRGPVRPAEARGRGPLRPGLHAAHRAVGPAPPGADRGPVPGGDPRRPVVHPLTIRASRIALRKPMSTTLVSPSAAGTTN